MVSFKQFVETGIPDENISEKLRLAYENNNLEELWRIKQEYPKEYQNFISDPKNIPLISRSNNLLASATRIFRSLKELEAYKNSNPTAYKAGMENPFIIQRLNNLGLMFKG